MSTPEDWAAAERQAVANAALEGIALSEDERELIHRRCRGEIDHEEFLRLARQIAITKARARE